MLDFLAYLENREKEELSDSSIISEIKMNGLDWDLKRVKRKVDQLRTTRASRNLVKDI